LISLPLTTVVKALPFLLIISKTTSKLSRPRVYVNWMLMTHYLRIDVDMVPMPLASCQKPTTSTLSNYPILMTLTMILLNDPPTENSFGLREVRYKIHTTRAFYKPIAIFVKLPKPPMQLKSWLSNISKIFPRVFVRKDTVMMANLN
jgi:hypothetical protein